MQHVLNVFDRDPSSFTDVLDGQIAPFVGEEEVQNAIGPVADVRPVTKIRQWFLWTALSFLNQR